MTDATESIERADGVGEAIDIMVNRFFVVMVVVVLVAADRDWLESRNRLKEEFETRDDWLTDETEMDEDGGCPVISDAETAADVAPWCSSDNELFNEKRSFLLNDDIMKSCWNSNQMDVVYFYRVE